MPSSSAPPAIIKREISARVTGPLNHFGPRPKKKAPPRGGAGCRRAPGYLVWPWCFCRSMLAAGTDVGVFFMYLACREFDERHGGGFTAVRAPARGVAPGLR